MNLCGFFFQLNKDLICVYLYFVWATVRYWIKNRTWHNLLQREFRLLLLSRPICCFATSFALVNILVVFGRLTFKYWFSNVSLIQREFLLLSLSKRQKTYLLLCNEHCFSIYLICFKGLHMHGYLHVCFIPTPTCCSCKSLIYYIYLYFLLSDMIY